MDSFSLEFSAYRIGGSDRLERTFHPTVQAVYPEGSMSLSLQGMTFANQMLRVGMSGFQVVRPGLMTAQMHLSDINGYPCGSPRPVLINLLACDVPLYSSHIATDPDFGVFSVGIRSPRSAWLATVDGEESPS